MLKPMCHNLKPASFGRELGGIACWLRDEESRKNFGAIYHDLGIIVCK